MQRGAPLDERGVLVVPEVERIGEPLDGLYPAERRRRDDGRGSRRDRGGSGLARGHVLARAVGRRERDPAADADDHRERDRADRRVPRVPPRRAARARAAPPRTRPMTRPARTRPRRPARPPRRARARLQRPIPL